MSEYNPGDIVTIQAVVLKQKPLTGRLAVKIIWKNGELHFRPFHLKNVASIPLSAIERFAPTWIMTREYDSHKEVEARILTEGIQLYEILWAVVENTWRKSTAPFKLFKINCSKN
jgi:hypothetical protein